MLKQKFNVALCKFDIWSRDYSRSVSWIGAWKSLFSASKCAKAAAGCPWWPHGRTQSVSDCGYFKRSQLGQGVKRRYDRDWKWIQRGKDGGGVGAMEWCKEEDHRASCVSSVRVVQIGRGRQGQWPTPTFFLCDCETRNQPICGKRNAGITIEILWPLNFDLI